MSNKNRLIDFLKFMFGKNIVRKKIINQFLRNSLIGYPHPPVNNLLINCEQVKFPQRDVNNVDNSKSYPLNYKQ